MAETTGRNKSNVFSGAPNIKVIGGASIGVANPALDAYPTDALTQYKDALSLKPAGYIGEDGISKTVDKSTEKIKEWGGDTVMTTQSDHSVMLKLTFMEAANADVLKMLYGDDNVEIDATTKAITVRETSDESPHRSIAFDINGGGGSRIRVFAPDVQVTSISDVTYSRKDVIKYEAELECFPDADGAKILQFLATAEAVKKATSSTP